MFQFPSFIDPIKFFNAKLMVYTKIEYFFSQMSPVDQSTGQELSSPLVRSASLDQPQVFVFVFVFFFVFVFVFVFVVCHIANTKKIYGII